MSQLDLEALVSTICTEAAIPVMDCSVTNGTTSRKFAFGLGSDSKDVTSEDGEGKLPDRFLIASITKPIVAMGALKLAAEGRLSLSAKVPELFPTLRNSTYRRITIRHLLTHSSGLAESVADNLQLRQDGASVDDFLAAAASESLTFAPGTNCKYSSIGYLLLGAVVEKLSGTSLPEYLSTQLFEPLGMSSTSLGTFAGDPTVLSNELPVWQQDSETWGWNSDYWKQFGAAWGGMYSTASDLTRLAAMLLNEGQTAAGVRVLPVAVVRSLLTNQTAWLRSQPEFSGPAKDWSFGFRMQWPAHSASFSDFVSGHAVGHWGATGTLLWIDPTTTSAACVLTTIPFEQSKTAIQKVSNLLATCLT